MAYLPGQSLDEWMAGSRRSIEEALQPGTISEMC